MTDQLTEPAEQTDELKKLVDDVEGTQQQSSERQQDTEQESLEDNTADDEVDILNLPPRRDVHRQSKQRIKLKMSRASTRLLSVIIIMLLLFGTAFYLWGENLWASIVNI